MSWRWLIFDHIDPCFELDKSARRHVRRRARELAINGRITPVLFAAVVGISVFWLWWITHADVEAMIQRVAPVPIPRLWSFFPLLIGMHILSAAVHFRAYVGATRLALRERGFEVCIHCGYWLRGHGEDAMTCPECGGKREPMPASAPPS